MSGFSSSRMSLPLLQVTMVNYYAEREGGRERGPGRERGGGGGGSREG